MTTTIQNIAGKNLLDSLQAIEDSLEFQNTQKDEDRDYGYNIFFQDEKIISNFCFKEDKDSIVIQYFNTDENIPVTRRIAYWIILWGLLNKKDIIVYFPKDEKLWQSLQFLDTKDYPPYPCRNMILKYEKSEELVAYWKSQINVLIRKKEVNNIAFNIELINSLFAQI